MRLPRYVYQSASMSESTGTTSTLSGFLKCYTINHKAAPSMTFVSLVRVERISMMASHTSNLPSLGSATLTCI